ncbi:hypothetical protein ACJO2E_15365 [Marinobacter sp. M1N3S26]|uniref:hypothetical protein n=1 Tax=unclassified Marinobacter TaxID=83889 RepID=UPI00387AB079
MTMTLHQKLNATLHQWWQRSRYRAALRIRLRDMDQALVEKDIGVPRGTLCREAHKPFWRP